MDTNFTYFFLSGRINSSKNGVYVGESNDYSKISMEYCLILFNWSILAC